MKKLLFEYGPDYTANVENSVLLDVKDASGLLTRQNVIDDSADDCSWGRLVNHSKRHPNLKPEVSRVGENDCSSSYERRH